jgi:micrococcal nuclease|tara:strand:+ start:23601 stop:24026 length:426 start_codon:yes stop_codon:yes gene_type:complete
MYQYSFSFTKVIDGDTVDGVIDLGFGISLKERIRLAGIDAPEIRLQKSIKDKEERAKEKQRGLDAKKRLQELLIYGSKQPEGLLIETFLDKKGKYGRILGDIKYIYARDLYNDKANAKPWIGYKSISQQLLEESLVKVYNK